MLIMHSNAIWVQSDQETILLDNMDSILEDHNNN